MKTLETAEQFQEVIQTDKPVMVKFFATWCPDCAVINHFIGDIIEEYSEYDWYEMNRDHVPDLAEKYEIMGIPSLLLFQNGEKIAHLHSSHTKRPEQITDFLNKMA